MCMYNRFPDCDWFGRDTTHTTLNSSETIYDLGNLQINGFSFVTFVHSHTLNRSLNLPTGSQSRMAGVADGELLFLCVLPQ